MSNNLITARRSFSLLLVLLGNMLYALTVKLFLMPADLMT